MSNLKPILAFDFEAKDPYISRGLAGGWAIACNNSNHDFKVLGCAFATEKGSKYVTDLNKVCDIAMKAEALVAHNLQYDLGCLYFTAKSLGRLDLIEKIQTIPVYCTKVMAQMHDSSLASFSLDFLGQRFFNHRKTNDELVNACLEADLMPWTKKDLKEKMKAESEGQEYKRQVDSKKVLKFAKENMDLLQEECFEVITKYAIVDAEICLKLFKYFEDRAPNMKTVRFYCNMCRICNSMRMKGVWVDANRISDAQDTLNPLIEGKLSKVYEIAGTEFNINSSKQLAEVCDKLGIKYGKTDKGNPQITTPWMEKQDHPLCKAMVDARKYIKVKRDFIDKLLEIREFTDPGTSRYFRIYPHLQVMGAVTGRFSSSGINIQQIPARDPVLGPLCRSLYVPKKGTKWFSLDYSNQEGRIQVHYAGLHNCEGADELILQFAKNPKLDIHQLVADMAGIERGQAKAINLGISYGMGKAKLADSLKLSVEQASLLMDKYHTAMPYLKDLNRYYMGQMKSQKYITTLGNRRSHLDKPLIIDGDKVTFEYKALNKLIQGSAADQIMAAMYLGYKAGLDIIFAVHDQICMQGTAEDAKKMMDIMNNCVRLKVPVVTDVDLDGGDSWGSAGH